MSSTTDGRGARGQVIVIFALSLVTLMGIAALAFDAGMVLLERRDTQNAADAAALAGARYLIDTPADPDPEPAGMAREMARINGFETGASETVTVNMPPTSGDYAGLPGFIEVIITSDRPTIFGSIFGRSGWTISARAVAANQKGLDLPFSMLTLHESQCQALKVMGTGEVASAGSIQVNSTCPVNALDVGGSGIVRVTADGAVCNVTGGIDEHGNGDLNCAEVENSYKIKDPLRNLESPPVPAYPEVAVTVPPSTTRPPRGCPGSTQPSTAGNPRGCRFNTAGQTWRLFPGFYPGGIDIAKGTVYLEPGIYYIGGGGFAAGPDGSVWTVDAGGTITDLTTREGFAGGILIYNTASPDWYEACRTGGTAPGGACLGPITLNGGSARINLKPLADGSQWDGLVVFGDRNLSLGGDEMTINGSASMMEVAGTIYLPAGDVKVNGSTGTLILDQVIASTFLINGNGGTIDIRYRSGVTARVSGVGLVE